VAATLEELEARVAALEAERVDYRAVLSAVNALGANQREFSERAGAVETRLTAVETRLTAVATKLDDTNTRVRSIEDNMAELKDLVIRALER
jgi:predicted  nucleic acid-binding Zn-ribbon protein